MSHTVVEHRRSTFHLSCRTSHTFVEHPMSMFHLQCGTSHSCRITQIYVSLTFQYITHTAEKSSRSTFVLLGSKSHTAREHSSSMFHLPCGMSQTHTFVEHRSMFHLHCGISTAVEYSRPMFHLPCSTPHTHL